MALAPLPASPPTTCSHSRTLRADPFALWWATPDSVLVVPVMNWSRLRVPGRFGLRLASVLPEVVRRVEQVYGRGPGLARHTLIEAEQVALLSLPVGARGSAAADQSCCAALCAAFAELAAAVPAAPLLVVPPLDDVAYGLPGWLTCQPELAAAADDRLVFCRP